DVETRHVDHLEGGVLLHLLKIGRPWISVDVALARLELCVARCGVGRDGEHEVVDQRLLAVKVLVRLVADDGILLIRDERERTGSDPRPSETFPSSFLTEASGIFLR